MGEELGKEEEWEEVHWPEGAEVNKQHRVGEVV